MCWSAVQNERDRISCRRPSYEESVSNNGLSVTSLLNAEMLSRQVGAAMEVSTISICNEHIEYGTVSVVCCNILSMNSQVNLLMNFIKINYCNLDFNLCYKCHSIEIFMCYLDWFWLKLCVWKMFVYIFYEGGMPLHYFSSFNQWRGKKLSKVASQTDKLSDQNG